jgi:replicative DNA helicase
MQEPQPFTPVEETEDKGKKWLTSTDIKRKKEQDLVAIPTGYQYLDKVIRGFILGEVTILSGLNGCVDCDTEFFDGTKWKKISDFKQGDKVLQYNQDGTTELVIPQRYIKSECSTLHLMKTKYGINQCLSDEHNVVYCTSKGNLAKKRMSDLIEQHSGSKHGFNGKFYTTFKYNGCGIDLSDEQIRVMCAVICDGSFTNKFANKKIVRINIKKHRKKERLERLLKEANIPFRKEQYNPKDKEYNTYLFESPRVEKEFGDYWYNCSNNQLRVIADEILNWDGYVTDKRKSFSTTSKKTADFVQFAFSAIGKRATILIDDRVGTMHSNNVYQYKSICYHVHICSNNMVSLINVKEKTKIEDYNTKDGYKYCFTVPSGMLVLRREGRINITGNSGKSSWLNSVMLNVIHRGFKVACFSGELTDYNVMKWLAQSAAGKNYVHKVEGSEYAYDVEDRAYDKIMEWLKEKFYLFNNNYGNNFSQVISDLDEVVKKGAQLIVIDNLMALQISNLGGDKNEKQKQFILEVVEFAKRHNVHVVVVCHPRKESGSQTLLRKESIAGSSDLSNAVQNVAIVHRCGEDFCKRASEFFGKEKAEKYMTYNNVVEVCKNRSYGVVDYLVGMYYEVETKRFKNSVAEHIVYGWQSGEQHNMYSQVQQELKVEQKEEMPFEPFDGCDAPF